MPPEAARTLARTPLYESLTQLNAKMTNFAGWEMPVQFTGINSEHQAVRTAAGIFDISHMGKFSFKGKNIIERLQPLVSSDISRLQPGEAQYTVLLNAGGGILDDIIFYYQGEDENGYQRGIAIVNACTKSRDKAWLLAHLESSTVNELTQLPMQDLSNEKVLMAIQGPSAVNKLQPFVEADLSAVKAFGHLEAPVLGKTSFIARTGYTGEDGFEVMVDKQTGVELWRALLKSGVTPCGLGCRDTLRLEAAMVLYGQDIDETTTPLEAGLGWVVHFDSKGDFIGRAALETQKLKGVKRKLVGLKMQGRHIARHGYAIIYQGSQVGKVTSGAPSPTLGYPIALAYVPTELANIGQQLEIEIRGKLYPAEVVKKPFYRSPSRLSRN